MKKKDNKKENPKADACCGSTMKRQANAAPAAQPQKNKASAPKKK